MLRSLFIQNYALIDKLDITFDKGFSVITGETGAGKSIMLGAIGLLLGQRADSKAIRIGENKCIIEAHFDIASYHLQPFFEAEELEYDDECILRRELYANGKSRAFINDVPAQLSQMKDLGEHLIDIHSQHRNLLLNKEDFQLNIIDSLAKNTKLRQRYAECFNDWRKLTAKIKALEEQAEKDRREEDFLQYQFDELNAAHLQEGEQEELENEALTLSHAEEIKGAIFQSTQSLDADEQSILSQINGSLSCLKGIKGIYTPIAELYDRLESTYIELKDIASELSDKEDDIEFNPERLEQVNDRLNLIYTLQKKHQCNTIESLIDTLHRLEERLNNIHNFDDEISALKENCNKEYQHLLDIAKELSKSRKDAALLFQKEMVNKLLPLGMPNVQFDVNISSLASPNEKGMDNICFLFSANKNGKLQSIGEVASGGEIARVMLSIKALVAGAVNLPTIIFDEIDTGVSGEIADQMAESMKEMAHNDCQVISITHLPQIASKGESHYFVYKEDNQQETNSHIRELTTEERITEIARMLSGARLTEAAITNAKELLKSAGK